jgi:hypothetical protein
MARNTNSHNASGKVQGSSPRDRRVLHTVKNVAGEEVQVKVLCKEFSGCLHEGGELAGKCLSCKETGEIQELCKLASGCFKVEKKERKEGSGAGRGVGEYPPFIKAWLNGQARGGMRMHVTELIAKGIYSKKEIIADTLVAFPDCSKNVPGMYIGHGMKGKGKDAKRFPYRIQENGGLLSFDEKSPKGSWGQE